MANDKTKNYGEYIVNRPDGTQVVKMVPPDQVLVHVPTGRFFPPNSKPGWNGIKLTGDWQLVDLVQFNQNYAISNIPRYKQASSKTIPKQIDTHIQSQVSKIKESIKTIGVFNKRDYEDVEEIIENLVEDIEATISDGLVLLDTVKQMFKKFNDEEKVKTVEQIEDVLKTTQHFLNLEFSKHKKLPTTLTIEEFYKNVKNLEYFLGILVKLSVTLYLKYKLPTPSLMLEKLFMNLDIHVKRASLLSELFEILEKHEKATSLKDKSLYQIPIELIFHQLKKLDIIAKLPFVLVPMESQHTMEENVFNLIKKRPDNLLYILKDKIKHFYKDFRPEKFVKYKEVNDNLFEFESDEGEVLQIRINNPYDSAFYAYLPALRLSYKGRNFVAPSVLRLCNLNSVSSSIVASVSILSNKVPNSIAEFEEVVDLVPSSYTFAEGYVYVFYNAYNSEQVEEKRKVFAEQSKEKYRISKLQKMFENLDEEKLLREFTESLLYGHEAKVNTPFIVEISDFLLLRNFYPEVFLREEPKIEDIGKIVEDLFGIKLLFSEKEKVLYENELERMSPYEIKVPYTYLLNSSLKLLSKLHYKYIAGGRGLYLDFSLERKDVNEFFGYDKDRRNGFIKKLLFDKEKTEEFLTTAMEFAYELAIQVFSKRGHFTEDMIFDFIRNHRIHEFVYQNQIPTDIRKIKEFVNTIFGEIQEARNSGKINSWKLFKGEMLEKITIALLRLIFSYAYREKQISTSKNKRKLEKTDIKFYEYEISPTKKLILVGEEKGGIGDVRMLFVDKEKKEVIPVIYELKARDKIIIPQFNSSKELYRYTYDILSTEFNEGNYSIKIYEPVLYGIGVQDKGIDKASQDYTPFFIDLTRENRYGVEEKSVYGRRYIRVSVPKTSIHPFSLYLNSVVASELAFLSN